ncbi:MAG: hypothetical protein [Bacteriophage sp.]|nr:MAG: hypothetical protein [Bacteriophage sp.]
MSTHDKSNEPLRFTCGTNADGALTMSQKKPLNPIADLMAKYSMTEGQVLAVIEQIRSDAELLKYGYGLKPKVATFEFPKDALIEKATIADGLISRCVIVETAEQEDEKDTPATLGKRYAELAELRNDCHHSRKCIDQIDSALFTISRIAGIDAEKHIDSLRDLAGFFNTVSVDAKIESKQISLKLKRMS